MCVLSFGSAVRCSTPRGRTLKPNATFYKYQACTYVRMCFFFLRVGGVRNCMVLSVSFFRFSYGNCMGFSITSFIVHQYFFLERSTLEGRSVGFVSFIDDLAGVHKRRAPNFWGFYLQEPAWTSGLLFGNRPNKCGAARVYTREYLFFS